MTALAADCVTFTIQLALLPVLYPVECPIKVSLPWFLHLRRAGVSVNIKGRSTQKLQDIFALPPPHAKPPVSLDPNISSSKFSSNLCIGREGGQFICHGFHQKRQLTLPPPPLPFHYTDSSLISHQGALPPHEFGPCSPPRGGEPVSIIVPMMQRFSFQLLI